MSLCIVLQDEEKIVIGADSRESIRVGNEFYATGSYMKKTRVIGDQVVFSTGNSYLASAILDEYRDSGNYSIRNLQEIKNKRVNEFLKEHGERFFQSGHELKHVAAFIVCTRCEGKNAIYAISSENQEITEIINEPVKVADGSRSNEAIKLLKKYPGTDLLEAYQYIYNNLSDETIGGELTIYLIDRFGIRTKTYPIIDSREIRMAPPYILWSREQGIVVEREDHASKAVFNSDELTFYANGEKALWFDLPKRKFIFGGDLEAAGGTFSGTLQGVDGTFTGTISAGRFEGGEIIGSTIRGGTITSDTDINITRDIRVGNSIYLGQSGQTNDRRIEFVDSGPYRSYIGFTNSTKQLELYAANDIRINSGLDVFINAMSVTLPSTTYLGSMNSNNQLVPARQTAYNMTFDQSTRNLKLWSKTGDLLAQVYIP